MNIYTIYKSTNKVNNKSYIGFDSSYPNRVNTHKSSSKKEDTKFYRAIRKYGWHNFEWSILYQSTDGEYIKNIMENYFITEYDSFYNGYNSTVGGDGCLGYKHTKEHIQKLKKRYDDGDCALKNVTPYERTPEHKNRMSMLLTGVPKSKEHILKRSKKVSLEWQVTKPCGEIIVIKNLSKFCRDNKLNQGAMIKVSQQKQNHHKGWKCKKINS